MPSDVLIAGDWVATPSAISVRDKFTGEVIGSVGRATPELAEGAVGAAQEACRRAEFPPYRRYEVLSTAAKLLVARREEFISLMVAETGFTVADCESELGRCVQTLLLSGEEAKRITGELVPVAGAPAQDQRRLAFTIRMPVGVVCAITPFNSPLNTVAHKVAPALAAGNAVVLKPSSYVPLTAAKLCDLLIEAGTPPGYLNVLFGSAELGSWLLEDQRIRYYTFTGSTEVGRVIQRSAGLRRTQLELGNISATIVCDDADIDLAAQRCVSASFRKAGQVCTSVQRILVDQSVLGEFAQAIVARAGALSVGDPRDPSTAVGPMIDEKEAARADSWVLEAVDAGAEILLGGARQGCLMPPTILSNVSVDMRVVCSEIFAPVVSLLPVDSFDDAVSAANATAFGLAVGVFTRSVTRTLGAIRQLEMGSIHINDTSSSRVDLMPYGGVKDSGFGHEGPRYAIRDMTELRLVTLNPT